MKNRNENQSKHIANTIRVVGMAQFVFFAQMPMQQGDYKIALIYAGVFAFSEFLAYQVLKETK